MATARQATAQGGAAASNAPAGAPVVKVIGQGTLLETGWPFLLVTSGSKLNKTYTCAYLYQGAFVGSRMVCSCMAGQFGKACKHVLVAREWLHAMTPTAGVTSSVTTHVKRQPARQKPPDAAGRNRQRDQRADHPGDTAMPRRSNKPFSLLK